MQVIVIALANFLRVLDSVQSDIDTMCTWKITIDMHACDQYNIAVLHHGT